MKKSLFPKMLILCSVGILSCTKELDFDQTDDLDINFGLNIPVMNATLDLSSFIDSNETILVDPDGGLRISLKEEDVFNFGIQDFTSVPDQQLFSEDLLVGNVGIGIQAEMDNAGGFSLSEFIIEDGQFVFTAVTSTSDPVDMVIKINNATNNGIPAEFHITSTGTTTVQSFNLNNLTVDFTNAGNNILDFEFASTTSAPPGTTINLQCEANNITILSLTGDFGNLEVDIPVDSFNLDIDGFDKFVDGLYFDNPSFNMIIESQLGFSMGLNLDLEGTNTSGHLSNLSADELVIQQAPTPGDQINDILSINNTNSNLPDFLSTVPNRIEYGGFVKLNPGTGPYSNFIHKDFYCSASLDIDIPMEIKVEDLVYETLMEDMDLLEDESDEILNGELLFAVKNKFPLDANINLLLLDANFMAIDSIQLPLLTAAAVGADGVATEYAEHEFNVVLTEHNINSLYDTENMKLVGHLSSTDQGSTVVKIVDSYDIKIKMAIKAEGSVSTNDDNQ